MHYMYSHFLTYQQPFFSINFHDSIKLLNTKRNNSLKELLINNALEMHRQVKTNDIIF